MGKLHDVGSPKKKGRRRRYWNTWLLMYSGALLVNSVWDWLVIIRNRAVDWLSP